MFCCRGDLCDTPFRSGIAGNRINFYDFQRIEKPNGYDYIFSEISLSVGFFYPLEKMKVNEA